MKANKGKCHFLISGSENIIINVDGNVIEKSNCEKLLGEKIFVLVLKNFICFLYIIVFYRTVFIVYSCPKLACVILSQFIILCSQHKMKIK